MFRFNFYHNLQIFQQSFNSVPYGIENFVTCHHLLTANLYVMKKTLLLSFMALLSIASFAQIEKGKVLISFNGSYRKETTGSGTSFNSSYTQGKYLATGATVGYFFTDHFAMGVGLDYGWVKEDRQTSLYLSNVLHMEQSTITSNTIMPSVYFGFYYPVVGRLYINAIGKLNIGQSSVKSYSAVMEASASSSTNTLSDITIPNSYGNSMDIKVDVFNATLAPEVVYFISSKVGLSLSLGGIYYTITDWKSEYANCGIDFAPRNWQVGCKISL
jgi:hypothetical protein